MTSPRSSVGLDERLQRAIRVACEARGDGEIEVALLISACAELDLQSRRDLAEHFEEVAREWGAWPPATGSSGGGQQAGNSCRDLGLFADLPKGVVL